MKESVIQSKISNYAKKNGWLVIKTIKLSDSGYPDLFMFKDGKTIFIEVKTEIGIQSELQKLRQIQLRDKGFTCEVCRSLEEFKNIIK